MDDEALLRRRMTNEAAFDRALTTHVIHGQKMTIRYRGGGEWQVNDRTVLFSGRKAELIKSFEEVSTTKPSSRRCGDPSGSPNRNNKLADLMPEVKSQKIQSVDGLMVEADLAVA